MVDSNISYHVMPVNTADRGVANVPTISEMECHVRLTLTIMPRSKSTKSTLSFPRVSFPVFILTHQMSVYK